MLQKRKWIALLLMLALVLGLCNTGVGVPEVQAQEAESGVPQIKKVSLLNTGAIYNNSKIQVEVEFEDASNISSMNVVFNTPEESFPIGFAMTSSTRSGNTFTLSADGINGKPCSMVLKSIQVHMKDETSYFWNYVSEGGHEGQLGRVNESSEYTGEYVEGCSFEVSAYPYKLVKIQSLRLRSDAEGFNASDVKAGDKFFLDITLKNDTKDVLKVNPSECEIRYDIQGETQTYKGDENEQTLSIAGGAAETLSIPISLPKYQTNVTGEYEINQISIKQANQDVTNWWYTKDEKVLEPSALENFFHSIPYDGEGNFTVTQASEAYDVEGPKLTFISMSTGSEDGTISTAGDVEFEIGYTDLTGIEKIQLELYSSDSSEPNGFYTKLEYKVPEENITPEGTLKFSAKEAGKKKWYTGTYNLSKVTMWDIAGNSSEFSSTTEPWTTSDTFTVVTPTPGKVTSIHLSTGNAERMVSDHGNVDFEIGYTEEDGIASIELEFDNNDYGYQTVTADSRTWTKESNVIKFSSKDVWKGLGEYTLDSITLYHTDGYEKRYTADDWVNEDWSSSVQNFSFTVVQDAVTVTKMELVDGEGTTCQPYAATITPENSEAVKAKVTVQNNTGKPYTITKDSYISWNVSKKSAQDTNYEHKAKIELGSGITVGEWETAELSFPIALGAGVFSGEAALNSIVISGESSGVIKTANYTWDEWDEILYGTFGDEENPESVADISYNGELDFNVTNDNPDTKAPTITSIKKSAKGEIHSDLKINFEVAYEDTDQMSEVADIRAVFKRVDMANDEYGLSAFVMDEGTVLGTSGTASLSFAGDSSTIKYVGGYELDSIEITDIYGNTRTYSDDGKEIDTTTWKSWKEACAFEAVTDKSCARISKIELAGADDLNQVKTGSSLSANITVENNSAEPYTIHPGQCRVMWQDEDGQLCAYGSEEAADITVPAGENKVLTIPVEIGSDVGEGKQILCEIYINDGELMCDSLDAEGGAGRDYYNYCNWTLVEAASLNADFTVANHVHSYTTQIVKATLSANGKIVKKCSCGAVESTTTIAYPKTIGLSAVDITYNGKTQTPAVRVTGSDGKAISTSNYTVSYASGRKKVGHYGVTITFKNHYTGKITKTFNINPKGTKISKVKGAKKKATVKWKKQTKYTKGYQVQYSTSKNFKSGVKTKTVNGSKKTSLTLKKLKSKKTYYVRIRTFQKVSGGKCYSSWSSVKKVKVK